MRSLVATTPILLALLLALVPLAEAQVPAAPSSTMTVTITGLPAEFSGLASNGTAAAAFSVDVAVTNIVCPAATTIPVTIEVSASGPPTFFSVVADPTEGTVAVGAGPQPSARGSVPASLVATLKEITANASVPVTVKATAGAPQGCQGTVPLSGSAEATIYANMTAPPPPPAPTPEPAKSPGPGALMGIVAAVGAAAIWRRRHA
jgi:hypothetical protein